MEELYRPVVWADLDRTSWSDFEEGMIYYLRSNVQDGGELKTRTMLEDNDSEQMRVWTDYALMNGIDHPHLLSYVFRKNGKLFAVRPSDVFTIMEEEDETEEEAFERAAELLNRDSDMFADRHMHEPDWGRAGCVDGLNIEIPRDVISI